MSKQYEIISQFPTIFTSGQCRDFLSNKCRLYNSAVKFINALRHIYSAEGTGRKGGTPHFQKWGQTYTFAPPPTFWAEN